MKKTTASRQDGWLNVATYLGMQGKDRTMANNFVSEAQISFNTLSALYRSNGFAKRIVDLISSEMTRQWFSVSGDTDGNVIARLEEIDAKSKVRDLIRWARLYGGAIAVMGIDDGNGLDEPIDFTKIRSLDFLHVFDRTQVTWSTTDLFNDPTNPKFGQVEFYTVTPVNTGTIFKVHSSRVLRVDGEKLPDLLASVNQGWGDSVLQGVYTELKNLGAAYNTVANIMEDFIQTTLSVDNLSEMIGAGQDDLVKKRLDIIDYSRSVANTIMLDSKESYSKSASSVAGLEGLIDRFSLSLAATTGIPYTFLMGQSPSGLQATGAADIRMFYDNIKSEQEDILQPILERLVQIVMLAKDGVFKGVELEDWQIEFTSLWQLTKEEEALYRKTIAETDAIYLDRGVVDPSEIAISRFGGQAFSAQTTLDLENRNIEAPNTDEVDDYVKARDKEKDLKRDEVATENKEFLNILKQIVTS